MKYFGKKALISALAISVGAASSTSALDKTLKEPLFSLKEVGSSSALIAHSDGGCGEGTCGGTKSETKAKTKDANCGEGKGEGKKAKKASKKVKKAKVKTKKFNIDKN